MLDVSKAIIPLTPVRFLIVVTAICFVMVTIVATHAAAENRVLSCPPRRSLSFLLCYLHYSLMCPCPIGLER